MLINNILKGLTECTNKKKGLINWLNGANDLPYISSEKRYGFSFIDFMRKPFPFFMVRNWI